MVRVFRCIFPGWEEERKTTKASQFSDAQKAFILGQSGQTEGLGQYPAEGQPQGKLLVLKLLYRQRNREKRFFNRIKHFRGTSKRYDKRPENYLAAVKLVAARIWCQSL